MNLSIFATIFGSNDDEQTDDLGAEHIAEAVYGQQSVYDITEAEMGEPVLRDFGSEYVTDYQIVIPLSVDADVDISPFVFDLPDGPELTGTLGVLGDFFGVESIDHIAMLEGLVVPIEWDDDSPSPDVNDLRSAINGDVGSNLYEDIDRALMEDSE